MKVFKTAFCQVAGLALVRVVGPFAREKFAFRNLHRLRIGVRCSDLAGLHGEEVGDHIRGLVVLEILEVAELRVHIAAAVDQGDLIVS